MSSHSPRRSVLYEDDGRWAVHPGLGRVRSGPRGRRSLESRFTYDIWRRERVDPNQHSSLGRSRPPGQIRQHADAGLETAGTRIKIESPEIKREPQDTTDHESLHDIPLFMPQDESTATMQHDDEAAASAAAAAEGDVEHGASSFSEEGTESDSNTHGQQQPPAAVPPPTTDPQLPTTIPAGCRCPISLQCEARDNRLIDCRTLVLEWEKWKKRQEKDSIPRPPIDVPPESEPFATTDEVRVIIGLLDSVQHRPRLSMALRLTFSRIQEWIRRMQNNSVTEAALDQTQVVSRLKEFLSAAAAAAAAADNNTDVRHSSPNIIPQHMIEDLTILQRKWEFGDLSVLARRGLRSVRQDSQLAVDPDWPWARNSDYFGHGHLVNGWTWHYRAEMCRDGAHGPLVAGIAGTVRDGARSIVMGLHDVKNKEYYADVDQGNTIWYMGTALKRGQHDTEPTNLKDSVSAGNPTTATRYRRQRVTKNSRGEGPTNATLALVTSCRTGNPVRVFRSFRLAEIVPLRPPRGYRYDGLYVVTDFELLKKERQIYRFRLERLTTGQGPLRETIAPPAPEPRQRKRRRT